MISREILKKTRQIELCTNRVVSGAAPCVGMFLSLLFLCSCATTPESSSISPATVLPADVTLNEDAGRGGWLIVMLRLESGEELPFIVDTGASGTLLDKSLEPKLGKRSGKLTIGMWGADEKADVYAAPKLYSGSTRLITGDVVATFDFKSISSLAGRQILGCLGMDCLQHYCIQIDFESGKMRFLNDELSGQESWGKAFPLTALSRRDARPCVRGNLFGATDSRSQIDTGDHSDGWLMPQFLQQWTNQTRLPANGRARSPEGVLDGETYPQVSLREADVAVDGIGLQFLSRHLVTLDFPKRTLYLKRTSIGPLAHEGVGAMIDFSKSLKEKGQLPGWSTNEHGALIKGTSMNSEFTSGTLAIQKDADSSVYHYAIARTSKNNPWKLQKAWRTDQNDKKIEEYPVP